MRLQSGDDVRWHQTMPRVVLLLPFSLVNSWLADVHGSEPNSNHDDPNARRFQEPRRLPSWAVTTPVMYSL